MADGCTIRDAIESDLIHVLRWWKLLGTQDIELDLHKIILKYGEGGGAFTAVLPSGEPVGFLNCAVIGDNAFIGHFIVRNDVRGAGIGTALLERTLEHIGPRNLALDCLTHLKDFYKKKGFTTESIVGTLRYYTVDHAELAASLKPEDDADVTVKPYGEEMLQDVIDYDWTICGHDRGDYLRPCLRAYEKTTFVARDAEGEVVGYAVAIKMTGGTSRGIFPLYGATEHVQSQLLRQVLMAVPDGSEICFYTPDDNTPAAKMIESLGARYVSQLKRLYTKHEVMLPIEKVASVLNYIAFGI